MIEEKIGKIDRGVATKRLESAKIFAPATDRRDKVQKPTKPLPCRQAGLKPFNTSQQPFELIQLIELLEPYSTTF